MIEFIWYAFMTMTMIFLIIAAIVMLTFKILWWLGQRGKVRWHFEIVKCRYCGTEHDEHDACPSKEMRDD